MQFLYPQFLYAFFALLIPVIIHLFYFRRFKTVYFSNVRFLSSLQEAEQTKSRLKHLLTLLTRLLILSFLILAFAQPYIPDKTRNNNPGKNAVSIYIDNSFSMEGIGQEGNLIEQAKKKAREVAHSYREADEFQVITDEFKTEHQQFYNRPDFLSLLDDITPTAQSKQLSQVIQRQNSHFQEIEAANKIAFIVTDFQATTTELEQLQSLDTSITYYLVPLQASKKDNLFLDSAWLSSPMLQVQQKNEVRFRIVNEGNSEVEDLTVKLNLNGNQKGITNLSIPQEESKEGSITLNISETGWNTGKLSIEDHPITFDDEYFLSFPVKKKASVMAINEGNPNPFLQTAYKTDDYFEFTNISAGSIDYSSFADYDLIILNELTKLSSGLASEIHDFITSGGNVLLLPPSNKQNSLDHYNKLLNRINANRFQALTQEEGDIQQINLDHPFFQDVFEEIPDNVRFPSVQQYYQTTSQSATRERQMLTLGNGQSLFSLYPHEGGNLFVSAIPFNQDWSQLPKHAMFVPLVYKMALFEEQPLQLAYTIGETNIIQLNRKLTSQDEVYQLTGNGMEVIPPQKIQGGRLSLYISNQIQEAGIYQLISNQANSKNPPQYAFNYNRKESRMATHSSKAINRIASNAPHINLIEDQYANLESTIQASAHGNFLWKTFLWLALGFLLVEIFLLKYLR